MERLIALRQQFAQVCEIRGRGFLIGFKVKFDGRKAVEACCKKGFLINCCGNDILRFLPPLIVTRSDIDFCIKTPGQVIKTMS